MKKNMGTLDRTIRIVVAIAIVVLYTNHVISGTLAIILLIVAAVFVLTSFISFCPAYRFLGITTKKNSQEIS